MDGPKLPDHNIAVVPAPWLTAALERVSEAEKQRDEAFEAGLAAHERLAARATDAERRQREFEGAIEEAFAILNEPRYSHATARIKAKAKLRAALHPEPVSSEQGLEGEGE